MAVRIGAHVRGGIFGMIDGAREVGAEVLQTFATNPRAWATPAYDRERMCAAGEEIRAAGLGPIFLHAPYLVNLASAKPEFVERSVVNLRGTLGYAEALGAGVVVHAGSAGEAGRIEGTIRVRNILLPMLETTSAPILIELMAGGTGAVASTWAEAAELLDALGGHERIRFCFDTCHAHAAGYDIATAEGVTSCFAEMEARVGVERLALIHANDSKDPRGSRRDRHEHLGHGTIGVDGFGALMATPAIRNLPIVVETPTTGQPDDIALLRHLSGD